MRIAIVKLSALGDIVHAMVGLQFIKAVLPEAEIDWVVEQGFAEAPAENPHVRQVLPVNLKALKTDKRLLGRELARVREYARAEYDLVIDAQGLLKSAVVARLLGRNCAGFDRDSIREPVASWFYRRKVAQSYAANTVARNLAVLTEPLGITVAPEALTHKQAFLFYRAPEADLAEYFAGQDNIVFVIGSTWPSRNYPKELYLEVMRALPGRHWISWGSADEQARAQWLAERCDARMLPKLNINDMKAVMAKAALVIGNDTGPTHMAWGLNRPSLTLFGPTPVSRVWVTPINTLLKSPSAVNPHRLNRSDFSIGEIRPEQVVAEALRLLGGASS
jgi:heptosyltransferase I